MTQFEKVFLFLLDGEEVVGVKKIIKHAGWNTNTYEHDIALIILERDLDTELRSTINTACLPLSIDIPAEYCFVAGWGVQKEGSRKQAKHLMQIKVRLILYLDLLSLCCQFLLIEKVM